MVEERSKQEYVIGDKKFYGEEIRKKGNFDISKFHKELFPWFSKNRYTWFEKGITGSEKSEGRYEKLVWQGNRKIDAYFRIQVEMETMAYRIGKPGAEIAVRFKGYLEKDYRNRFQIKLGRKFGEFLRRVYERYVIHDKIEKMKNKVRYDITSLINETKEVLGLITK